MENRVEHVLREIKEGIYLAKGHAQLIHSGEKLLIVKAKLYKNKDKILYFLERGLCYGIIKLKAPDNITIQEFEELRERHQITDIDRRKWWPRKEVLYSYRFDLVKLFGTPKPVSTPIPTETFTEFKFLEREPTVMEFQQIPVKEVKELESVVITPFYPMKPNQGFYKMNEVIKYMFQRANKYALEKKYPGLRVMLHRSGNTIKIYSDQREALSERHPKILLEAESLSNKDFVLDGELVSDTVLHVFDIIHLGGKDLTSLPWHHRKSILHSLRFQPHIKEVHSLIVDRVSDAQKAITLLRNMDGSAGAVIKRYDSIYNKAQKTDAWITLRTEGPTITSTTGIPDVAGKTWKKKIPGPKKMEDMTEEEREEHLAAKREEGVE